MKLSNFSICDCPDETKAEISFEKDIITVKSLQDKYTVSKLTSDKFGVIGKSLYKFNAQYSGTDFEIRFIYNFLDKNGKSIFRGYADNGEEIIISENAKFVYFEIVVFSFSAFELEIKKVSFEYAGEAKKNTVTLAAVHIDSVQDVETTCDENLRKALIGIDRAAAVNPDIIVLTECFYDRRVWSIPFPETYVSLDSEPVEELRKKAAQYKCYIATSLHIKDGGRYYNRGILINRQGNIEGFYDKTHLTMGEREQGNTPGREARVFETDFGKVAFAICWDLWFPKLINDYYRKGVRVLINPTAGFPDTQMRARAIDNGMYIISPTIMSRVRTRIINPLGEVISTAEVNGYAYATVDLNEKIEEYWLSVGDTYGEGRNIYIHEEAKSIKEE